MKIKLKRPLKFLFFLLFISFFGQFVLLAKGTSERDLPPKPNLDKNKIARLIVYYTNIERIKHGLPLFRYHPVLEKGAKVHSEYMAQNRVLSHSEPALPRPQDRVKAGCEQDTKSCMDQFYVPRTGYFRVCCSENVIESFDKTTSNVPFYVKNDAQGKFRVWTRPVKWFNEHSLARDMVKRWMNSPGHRANILDKQTSALGAAVVFDGQETFYGTQVFSPLKQGPLVLDESYAVSTNKPDKEVEGIQILYTPLKDLKGMPVFIKPLAGMNVNFKVLSKEKVYILHVTGVEPGKRAVFRVEHQDSQYPFIYYPVCQFYVSHDNGKWKWDWVSW